MSRALSPALFLRSRLAPWARRTAATAGLSARMLRMRAVSPLASDRIDLNAALQQRFDLVRSSRCGGGGEIGG